MSKFKIFEKPKEKIICYFKLDYNPTNNISLIAVDENGVRLSTLLTISDDGSINTHRNVDKRSGLRLDAVGRVKIVEE